MSVQSLAQKLATAAPPEPAHATQVGAGYMGPENGPFMCARCQHFQPPAACEKVQGVIAPQGCCNFFDPPKA